MISGSSVDGTGGGVSVMEKAAGAALFVEATALLVGGAVTMYYAATGQVERGDTAVFVSIFSIAVGVGVGLAARGLLQGKRWSRGAAMAWQVLQGSVAVQLFGPNTPLAVALLVPVIIVVAGVVVGVRREVASEKAATAPQDG